MKKRCVSSCAIALALTTLLSIPAMAAGQTFSDVPTTHWAYKYIEAVADAGIVTGAGNNQYNPSGTVSTAEFGTMITRAFRESSLKNELYSYNSRNNGWNMYEKYSDSDKWWAPYMECMDTGGLLEGTTVDETGGTYRNKWTVETVEAGISRYDMAMVIYNLMNALYTDFEVPSSSEMNAAKSDISDWSSIPAKYQDAVAACYAEGYLSGVDSTGRFDGTSTMDRAQAAAVMYRLTTSAGTRSGNVSGTQPTNSNEQNNNEASIQDGTGSTSITVTYDYDTYVENWITTHNIVDKLTNGKEITDENIRELVYSLQTKYPEGMLWGDANGEDCSTFVTEMRDNVFGADADQMWSVTDFDNFRAGDILYMDEKENDNAQHYAFIIEKTDDGVRVVEGNYNGRVHWGRWISREYLENCYRVYTRSYYY